MTNRFPLIANATSNLIQEIAAGDFLDLSDSGIVNSGNITANNLISVGTITATGNIQGSYILGNGSQLTGLPATYSNADVAAYLPTYTGNITAGNILSDGYYYANGSPFVSSNYGNANVAAYLPTYTGDITATNISTTGNITGANIITGGASGNISGANVITANIFSASGNIRGGNLNTVGNVTASYFIGDGSQLTGLPAAYANTNAAAYGEAGWAGNIIPYANTTYSLGNATNVWAELYVSDSSIIIGGVPLTSVGTTLQFGGANLVTSSPTGVISATGNIQGSNILTTGYVSAQGNVTTGNVNTAGAVSAAGNVSAGNVNTSVVRGTSGITVSTGSGNINLSPISGNIIINSTYINGVADPIQNQDVATKGYVDIVASTGILFHSPVYVATVNDLATATSGTITYTQPNGAGNGIGATITTTGSFNLIDTANVQTVGTRILVKNEGNAVLNGVYTWSNATAIVRSTDADEYAPSSTSALSINDYFFVQSGSVNAGSAYVVNGPTGVITFGTSDITFAQFSTSQVYTANSSAGLNLVGTVFNAKVDGITTAFDVSGNISVKPSANLTTPNIGDATGTTLNISGNVSAGNLNATNHTLAGYITATGNVYGSNLLSSGVISTTGNIIAATAIGIGNTNPPYPLYVNIASTGAPVARFAGGTNIVDIYAGSGGTSYIGDANAHNAFGFNTSGNWLDIWTNDTEQVRIDSQGSMMIGGSFTSPPAAATLVVAGVANSTSTTTGALQVAGGAGIVGNVTAGNITTAGIVTAKTGTFTPGVNGVGTGLTVINGDLTAYRTGGTTGLVYLNSAGSAYVYWDGTNYNLPGGPINTGGLSATGNVRGGNLIATTAVYTPSIVNSGTSAVGNIGSSAVPFNTIFAQATSAQYADLAEMYCADAEYAPGTVIEFGGTQEVTISSESHSTKVAGIVSTNPSYLMNSTLTCDCATEIALVGRVPCRVVGTIRKGDRLVASNIPGVATLLEMSQYQPGCIIGKALEDYNSTEVGEIEVAVGRN